MTIRKTSRFPLHITISTLFIGLILLFGGLLSWQSYNKTSEIIFSSAERVYTQAGNELQLDFRATYRPVASELRLLALSPERGQLHLKNAGKPAAIHNRA